MIHVSCQGEGGWGKHDHFRNSFVEISSGYCLIVCEDGNEWSVSLTSLYYVDYS